jgi:hypothetical protein
MVTQNMKMKRSTLRGNHVSTIDSPLHARHDEEGVLAKQGNMGEGLFFFFVLSGLAFFSF